MILRRAFFLVGTVVSLGLAAMGAEEPVRLNPPGPPLPGTSPLTSAGDLASNLVAGVDRFLDDKLGASVARRDRFGGPDRSSLEAYQEAQNPERRRLATLLGVVERRAGAAAWEWISHPLQPSLQATSSVARVSALRWAAFGDVTGEGLLLEPVGTAPKADVIALPDADLTPEAWVGLETGSPLAGSVPLRLVEAGCRVVVPFLIPRTRGGPKTDWDPGRGRNLTDREFLYRAAFEMGRTVGGYEVTKVLALIDLLRQEDSRRPLGLWGWGEGGRLALHAAALDPRIRAVTVSGYFGPRERTWEEPIDRNVFGLLERFGDAELAGLIAPRALVVEACGVPDLDLPGQGGAPGRLRTVPLEQVRSEWERARKKVAGLPGGVPLALVASGDGVGPAGSTGAVAEFLRALVGAEASAPAVASVPLQDLRRWSDPRARADRQRRELDRHTQGLLTDSGTRRAAFMSQLDFSSPEKFAESQERYRRFFRDEVIGRFDDAVLPPQPRSRRVYEAKDWVGYEVVLDVFTDVIATGLLLLPKDLEQGERRPVVVTQHGLEGRPEHTIGKEGFGAYSAFSAELARRGYIVFSPQNLYLFEDRFRVLQRKANPLGKTLFSIIVPQHQQIVDWLQTLPGVDPQRIAFYGLSYGGKTAMRVPPLVPDYCLSICSADFNDWVWKNASTRSPYSYVWTGEYEIFEWNLGHTFNYAEMAALIAPRPFMVERGHFDGVAPDETVGYEFAKVQHLYAARLRRPYRDVQIEWFVGPHQIHGVGTFEFLAEHLRWERGRP